MVRCPSRSLTLLAAVAVVAGCTRETPAPQGQTADAAAQPVVEDTATQPSPSGEPDPAAAPAEPERRVTDAAWAPPFPERIDLFQPPRFAGRITGNDEGSNDSVVLMGFADLGTPQAVLAIDGVVKPLAGGAEYGGVTVISIAPPRAVLQRGRTRWTASIE